MTVREKAALSKQLSRPGIKSIRAKSNIIGELQIVSYLKDGTSVVVFLPSSVGVTNPRWVNLLDWCSVETWRESKSLLNAVRMGHVTVILD